MDIRNLVMLIWRWLWMIGAAALLTGTAVYQGMSRTGAIPRYSATTIVAIGGDMYQETQDVAYIELAKTMMSNLLQLARLEIVTDAVAQNLGLPDSPKDIAEMLDVSLIEGTNLISIQVTHHNPETAAAVANEVARQFRQLSPSRWRNFVLVVESAQPPTSPNRTAVLPVILTAFTTALLVVSAILLKEYFRQPFYDERDVTERLRLPTLLSLKPIPFVSWRYLRGNLFMDGDNVTWWSLKETCRRIMTETKEETNQQTILVLSPDAHVSQEYVAVQLALAWADEGLETSLANLYKYFQVLPDCPQLQALKTRPSLQHPTAKQVQQTVDDLWAQITQNPIAIVSAPPATGTIGTLMMARRATLVVFVLDAWHTGYRQAIQNISLLAVNGVKVDGIVLANLGTRTFIFNLVQTFAVPIRRLLAQYKPQQQESSASFQIDSQGGLPKV